MPTFTSPSGKEYQWNNPNPPTKADIDALVAYDSQLSGQPQSQGPATIAEMRRREEAGQVSALTPAQVQAQVGSPQQLEQAVQDAKDVGMGEQFLRQFGQMAEPTGQISPFVGGTEARIAPSGQFTPLGAAEARGMRRGFATGLPIAGSLLAAPFVAGMTPLAGALTEAGVGLTTAAIGQTVSPEPYRAGEMFAQAIPGAPVAQQARKLTQVVKEAGGGMLTSGAQAGLESLDQESADFSDALLRTGLGGFLSPALSGSTRIAGATLRAKGFSPRAIAAEFQRPFTQQFIQDRADEISKEMTRQGAVGISERFASDLARTLYSPNSGLNPQQFSDQIKNVVVQSLNTAGSSGLTGQELSSAIKGELEKFVRAEDQVAVNAANQAVDNFVNQSEALRNRVTNIVDRKNASRDARLTDVVRSVEGRIGIQEQQVQDQLDQLKAQRAAIPSESVERQALDAQISDLNQQIASIKAGQAAGYGPAAGISKEELGLQAQELAQKELSDFKAERKKGYGQLEPQLEKISITVMEKNKKGVEVPKQKTVNQLREERSKILDEIDFNKQVQKADFSVFERLDDVNSQIDKALESNAGLKAALQNENRLYKEGITRFKGVLADKVLREAGEAGGMPGIVSTIAGASGAQNLKLIQNLLGNRYEGFKPNLRQYVYTQIRGENPNQFLEKISAGKSGIGTGIQKEVIEELFPDLSEINQVATQYNALINRRASVEQQANQLKKNIEDLQSQVDEGVQGAKQKMDALLEQRNQLEKTKANLTSENITGRESRIIDSLGKIKARVRDAGAAKQDVLDQLKLDDVIRNLEVETGKPLYKALEEAVETTSAAKDKFAAIVNKALQPGGQLDQFEPTSLIDFLTAKGEESLGYRSQRFLKAVGQARPDLIGDAQNILVGRIIAESVDGNKINTAKIKDLVGSKESPGKYYGVTKGLLGDDGVSKISKIADQLEQVSDLGKPSVFSKVVAPTIAGYLGYQAYGPLGAGAGLGGYAAYSGLRKGLEESVQAAIGKIIKTPEYLNIVSKPIDTATQAQMNKIERMWPRILKMEQDRYQMIKEDLEK